MHAPSQPSTPLPLPTQSTFPKSNPHPIFPQPYIHCLINQTCELINAIYLLWKPRSACSAVCPGCAEFAFLDTSKNAYYRKNSEIWDTSNNCHNCLKNRKVWCNIALMHPKDADGMANSIDPDQTASSEAVWSWSALFAETYLSQYIDFVRYIIGDMGRLVQQLYQGRPILNKLLNQFTTLQSILTLHTYQTFDTVSFFLYRFTCLFHYKTQYVLPQICIIFILL